MNIESRLRLMEATGRAWLPRSTPTGYDPYPQSLCCSLGEAVTYFVSKTGFFDLALRCLPSVDSRTLNYWKLVAARRWLLTNGPIHYVSPAVVDLANNTDILDSIIGTDIATTHPASIYILPPSRRFVSPTVPGSYVTHILLSHFDKEEDFSVLPDVPWRGRGCMLNCYWTGQPCINSMYFPLCEKENLRELIAKFNTPDTVVGDIWAGRDVEETNALCDWATALIFNLLLIGQSYPEYTQPMSSNNSANRAYMRKSDEGTVLPVPRSYSITRPPTIRARTTAPSGGGTHQSPKVHWRRGHWRRQPHGEQWAALHPEVRAITSPSGEPAHMVWLEPILVGVNEDA